MTDKPMTAAEALRAIKVKLELDLEHHSNENLTYDHTTGTWESSNTAIQDHNDFLREQLEELTPIIDAGLADLLDQPDDVREAIKKKLRGEMEMLQSHAFNAASNETWEGQMGAEIEARVGFCLDAILSLTARSAKAKPLSWELWPHNVRFKAQIWWAKTPFRNYRIHLDSGKFYLVEPGSSLIIAKRHEHLTFDTLEAAQAAAESHWQKAWKEAMA